MGMRMGRFFLAALFAAYAANVAAAGAVAMWRHEAIGWPSISKVLAVNPIAIDTWPYYVFAIVVLAVEPAITGWHKSSLRRLLVAPSASATTDMIYCAINVSGLMVVLSTVAGFGIGVWLDGELEKNVGIVLHVDWPIWLALPVGFTWIMLADYLQHRFQHSRLMWPLHKSHHASIEFTVLSAFRAHPFDALFSGLAISVSLALVGFTPETVLALQIVVYVNNIFTHSNLTCLAALERFGFVTAAGHRLHHSSEPRYHDCNFANGWNVWDRVFGTYVAPPADIDDVAIGVDDGEAHHDTGRPLRDMWVQTLGWLSTLRREAGALIGRRTQAKVSA